MAVRLRGDVYWLDVQVNGRRYRMSLETKNKYVAHDKARTIERALRGDGAGAGGAVVELTEIAERYRAWARSAHVCASQEATRLQWILTRLEAEGVHTISQLTTYHIETLRGRLRDAGKSKATINRYMQVLRCLIYRAIEWGYYTGENPMRRVRFYREDGEIRPMSPEDSARVLAVAQEISRKPKSKLQRVFYDMCEFSMYTGVRRSEALGLQWIDIRGAVMTIRGKGDKLRRVNLCLAARAVLDRQDRHRTGEGVEYVFDVPNRGSSSVFRRTTEQISERVGFKFHFHLCRHFFASQLIARGADIITVSALLGHSRSMTSLLYTHADPRRMRDAVLALDREGVCHLSVTRHNDLLVPMPDGQAKV